MTAAQPSRRGRGRPRVEAPRAHVIGVRVTADELRQLQARARAAGLRRVANLVRAVLFPPSTD